eukprot:2344297-Amphidinium_carterae.1
MHSSLIAVEPFIGRFAVASAVHLCSLASAGAPVAQANQAMLNNKQIMHRHDSRVDNSFHIGNVDHKLVGGLKAVPGRIVRPRQSPSGHTLLMAQP